MNDLKSSSLEALSYANFLLDRMLCDSRLSEACHKCPSLLAHVTGRFCQAEVIQLAFAFLPPHPMARLEPPVAQMDHLKSLWWHLLAKVTRTFEEPEVAADNLAPWICHFPSPHPPAPASPLIPLPTSLPLSHHIMHFCLLQP